MARRRNYTPRPRTGVKKAKFTPPPGWNKKKEKKVEEKKVVGPDYSDVVRPTTTVEVTKDGEPGKINDELVCNHPYEARIPGLDADFCTVCRTYYVDCYTIQRMKEDKRARNAGSAFDVQDSTKR